MEPTPPEFLDVERLLESSRPRPRSPWVWYMMAALGVIVLLSSVASSKNPELATVVRLISGIFMLGVVVALAMMTSHTVKMQKQEQQRVEAIEELVQLRRWDQAATLLETHLSQPARNPGYRLQSLIYLAGVLARYHRFADTLTLQKYLVEHADFEPQTMHGLKLMRAMAILHEDHLFDADRAISELRRDAPESAGLALVEMYRDVKTGHPAEAIQIFADRLPVMRAQLGHRIADAYALAAKSHDLLEQDSLAAESWKKATLLSPPEEIERRYPELKTVREKYPASLRPQEAA